MDLTEIHYILLFTNFRKREIEYKGENKERDKIFW